MDKSIQFPPIEVESHTTLGSVDNPPVTVLNMDRDGANLTGFPDTFMETPAHSSSAVVKNLPSFNMMNDSVRKCLPASSTKLPDLKRSRINFEGKTCVREFITQVEEYFLYKNFDEALLVGSFSDLLSGSAAKWFRTICFNIAS